MKSVAVLKGAFIAISFLGVKVSPPPFCLGYSKLQKLLSKWDVVGSGGHSLLVDNLSGKKYCIRSRIMGRKIMDSIEFLFSFEIRKKWYEGWSEIFSWELKTKLFNNFMLRQAKGITFFQLGYSPSSKLWWLWWLLAFLTTNALDTFAPFHDVSSFFFSTTTASVWTGYPPDFSKPDNRDC